MAFINISQNLVCQVDDDLFESLNQFKWFAYWNKDTQSYYAGRMTRDENGKRYFLSMHRQILGFERGDPDVDHQNHDTLDNRKQNLRPATQGQNSGNRRKSKNNTSGFKGVSFKKSHKLWVASIRVNYKLRQIGYFRTPEEAHEAYCQEAIKEFGEFACFD